MSSPPYLGSVLTTLHFFGVPMDLETPGMATGSFELAGPDSTVTLDVMVGPQGVPGEPSPIVKMQYEVDITDPADLPTNLENNSLDIGKAYWVGNIVYVWTGNQWFQRQMGVPGPPGPVPNITPSAELVPSGESDSLTVPIQIVPSGTALNPGWLIRFDQDSITGPAGPSGPIRDAADYYDGIAPTNGQAILWSTVLNKFFPGAVDLANIQVFSVPEASFTSYLGFGTQQLISSYPVPAQPFDWKPLVIGHIQAQGVSVSVSPLIIGCEVLLGDAMSGQRIGRGFGNIANYTTIVPHFSTPTTPNAAITPDNDTAKVPAYHTGSQGTVYVRLYNDGAIGEYSFNAPNAQLLIICWPVSQFITAPGS